MKDDEEHEQELHDADHLLADGEVAVEVAEEADEADEAE